MGNLVETEQIDNISRITIHHNARRNALSLEVIDSLRETLSSLKDASDTHGIILRSEGDIFCAGHNLIEIAQLEEQQLRELFEAARSLFSDIRSQPQVVLCGMQGPAIGAGCQLVLSCDLVVAASNASFRTVGAKKGWFCTLPMMSLAEHLGPKRAFEILFTGEPIEAQKAMEWGLVNKVVPSAELDRESLALMKSVVEGVEGSRVRGKAAFYQVFGDLGKDEYSWAATRMASEAFIPEGRSRIEGFRKKKSYL